MMTLLEKALGFDPKSMKLRTELICGSHHVLNYELYLSRKSRHPVIHRNG